MSKRKLENDADNDAKKPKGWRAKHYLREDHHKLVSGIVELLGKETKINVQQEHNLRLHLEATSDFHWKIDDTINIGFKDMLIESEYHAETPFHGYRFTVTPQPESIVSFSIINAIKVNMPSLQNIPKFRVVSRPCPKGMFWGTVKKFIVDVDFENRKSSMAMHFDPGPAVNMVIKFLGPIYREGNHYVYKRFVKWEPILNQLPDELATDGIDLNHLCDVLLKYLWTKELAEDFKKKPYNRIRCLIDKETVVKTWTRGHWMDFIRFGEDSIYRRNVLNHYNTLTRDVIQKLPTREFFGTET